MSPTLEHPTNANEQAIHARLGKWRISLWLQHHSSSRCQNNPFTPRLFADTNRPDGSALSGRHGRKLSNTGNPVKEKAEPEKDRRFIHPPLSISVPSAFHLRPVSGNPE